MLQKKKTTRQLLSIVNVSVVIIVLFKLSVFAHRAELIQYGKSLLAQLTFTVTPRHDDRERRRLRLPSGLLVEANNMTRASFMKEEEKEKEIRLIIHLKEANSRVSSAWNLIVLPRMLSGARHGGQLTGTITGDMFYVSLFF